MSTSEPECSQMIEWVPDGNKLVKKVTLSTSMLVRTSSTPLMIWIKFGSEPESLKMDLLVLNGKEFQV
jgi:hypothetical protein